ncbi:MAG: hypothetical protein EXR92_04550 [Gemmatimonadetes bacterium]|nr:hypothetical protein [Gemmatimonadota bacterium]
MTGTRWIRIALLAALLGASISGCRDQGSAGPGTYDGSVELSGGSPGAVLLLFTGDAIQDVVGEGGTMSWAQPGPASSGGELRALLVDPGSSGALTFRVEVDDVSAGAPRVVVIEITDRENGLLSVPQDVRVHLSRR